MGCNILYRFVQINVAKKCFVKNRVLTVVKDQYDVYLSYPMRFELSLINIDKGNIIGFNYHYPLSAAIYKIIQAADSGYAAFLHEAGYGEGLKKFKLFTFSQLETPFRIKGDRLVMATTEARLQVCFFLPRAAETFIKGLFRNRELQIADKHSKVTFLISQVEGIAETLPAADAEGMIETSFEPLSPLVVGRKNERGNYDYLLPEDKEFTYWLVHNLVEKWASVYGRNKEDIERLKSCISLKVELMQKPPQQRLITIKEASPEETKIRGAMRFGLWARMPKEVAELALGAGMGLYNAMGMGCVRISKNL